MGQDGSKFDPRKLTKEDKEKLESGKPLQPAAGIKITRNPVTGKLEGVP